ncbi:unnamed protein product [Parnassius apollo]|uniref:(apollo) hypothetical protein n=1 Tax=Parnassius apollo TaxID=110799 RepID=A0A8S3Y6Q7_PARAO|nr:unnamed protein product [Parnassius apollo]
MIPLFSEREDSGIDSDDADRERRVRRLDHGDELAETSSSDEDLVVKPPCARPAGTNDSNNMEEGWIDSPQVIIPMMPWQGRNEHCCDLNLHPPESELRSSPDRSSPPLYEVELTASDEDDDNSVLELVIPVQNSRYKRVPTSSPTKVTFVPPKLFCKLFCCFCN